MNDSIKKSILSAIAELNEDWNIPSLENPGQDTVLLGEQSKIDSMGLVILIALVEENIKEKLGVDLVLADDRAFSRNNSPFRSVGTLEEYVLECLHKRN